LTHGKEAGVRERGKEGVKAKGGPPRKREATKERVDSRETGSGAKKTGCLTGRGKIKALIMPRAWIEEKRKR